MAASQTGLNPPCREGLGQLGIGSELCSRGLGISEPSGDLQPPGHGGVTRMRVGARVKCLACTTWLGLLPKGRAAR